MSKKLVKTAKRALGLVFAFLLSIESFAAIVTDNDGSAFVTKAEFEELKENFANELEGYNQSIDNKLDGAIASYIAGINVAKREGKTVGTPVAEVYCMPKKGDTETKDLRYVFAWPVVEFNAVCWSRWNPSTYGYKFNWTKKTNAKTGERNLIRNTIDRTSTFNGCAEWLGHINNVYEEQSWSATEVQYNATYGWHFNSDTYNMTGISNSAPIYNVNVGGTNWLDGGIWSEMDNGMRGNSGNYTDPLSDIYIDSIDLVKQSNSTLSKNHMIIWSPEKQYAFTEDDKNRFWKFDANDITGWTTSKTYAPKLYKDVNYTNYNQQSGVTHLTDLFTAVTVTRSAWQEQGGVGVVAQSTKNRTISSCTNWTKSDSYEITNKRNPYPCEGFPWKSIDNWQQLYILANDWSVKNNTNTSDSIINTPAGDKHLSLNGGWPIIETKETYEYEYEISFKENKNHLVFAKIDPFTTDNPQNEDTIVWDKTVLLDTNYKNAALIQGTKVVKLKFEAPKTGVLFLKWCEQPSSTSSALSGGGTLLPSATIVEITK